MSDTIDVAVVGATSLVGETVVKVLEERGFPVGELYLLDDEDAAGTPMAFRDRQYRVKVLEKFDFGQARIAFFCGDAGLTAGYLQEATAAGCVVVDRSPLLRNEPDVPLVVPEVNAGAAGDYGARQAVASPSCVATALAVALKPILDAAGLERVEVVAMQSVSGLGRAGVEALAGETARLLNTRPVETSLFPKQMAFNLLPQVDELTEDGSTREEHKVAAELRRVFDDARLEVNATCVRVPVFFGHSMAVHLRTTTRITVEAVRELLSRAPGIAVLDSPDPGGWPTPVTDAVEQDAVWVGRIREDASHPNGLNLWVVTDNLRKGAALNLVQIAELLVKDYL